MVPEFEESQDALGAAVAIAQAVAEAVEVGIEVVVVDDEQPLAGMALVVVLQMAGELEAHGCFAGTFLAEDDRGGRLGRVAIDLVPSGVVGALDAELFEDGVGLGVFLGEWVAGDAVVVEELLDFDATLGFRF